MAVMEKLNTLSNLFNFQKGLSTQKSVGFRSIAEDGTMLIDNNVYSRIIEFDDISYRLASDSEKNKILDNYLSFINTFDSETFVSLKFFNQKVNNLEIYENYLIELEKDNYNMYREELNNIIINRIKNSDKSTIKRKFIIYTIIENNPNNIKNRLNQIEQTILNQFKQMKVSSYRLDRVDWINLINNILDQEEKEEEYIINSLKQGLQVKDFVAPDKIDYKTSTLTSINNTFYKTLYLDITATEITDELLSDILDFDKNIILDITFRKIPLQDAIKNARNIYLDVNTEIVKQQKNASRNGYSPDIISPTLKDYEEEVNILLQDLQKNNENYFLITILLTLKGGTEEAIKILEKDIQSKISKHMCQFKNIYNQNEKTLINILTGINKLKVERGVTSKNLATLIPFVSQELILNTDSTLNYGINSLSKNIIMADRKELKNPAGLILGTPGSGKSFIAKIELISAFLSSNDDILVIDPEAEYIDLANELDGEVIEISPESKTFVNPFDITFEAEEDISGIRKNKSLFIISLIEILVGGITGLTGSQISIIDRCVNKIYDDFFENPSKNNMPTFLDFYNELLRISTDKKDTASELAELLEIYVKGSMSIFNNRTNVDIKNRLTVFDISKLNGVLEEVGMFILQDYIWNKTYNNYLINIWTRVYIDEFHRILRKQKSAEYMRDMFKTFRKRGGILTGITQNVSDFLETLVSEAILKNSSFAILLNQNQSDAKIISKFLDINDEKLFYLDNVPAGEGLISFEGTVIPFKNEIKQNTKLYKLITTKFSDR